MMWNLKKTARLLLAVLMIGAILALPAFAADGEDQIDYSQLDNETAVFTYLTREMGLNTAAACGVLANIQYESGFDPTVWGDGGTSHGLCQWHNGRCSALSSFCAANGYDEESVYGQMAYLNYELTNSYTSVLETLRSVADNADGAYEAAWYWCYYFEVPADRDNQANQRGQSAANSYYPAYEGLDLTALTGEDAEASAEDGESLETSADETGSAKEPEAPEPPPVHRRRPPHRHP